MDAVGAGSGRVCGEDVDQDEPALPRARIAP
jgi:hypothetical protein